LESMWPGGRGAPVSRHSSDADEFTSRLGWIPLTQAINILKATAGDNAWEQIKAAIRHKRLPAQGLADGVTKDLEPPWVDFLAWNHPEKRDNLWFDNALALRKGVRAPLRVENIVVEQSRFAMLWPNSGLASAASLDGTQGLSQSRPLGETDRHLVAQVASLSVPKKRKRGTKREAAERAIRALWPDAAPWGPMKAVVVRINEWLKAEGAAPVSPDTVIRAIKGMAQQEE